MRSFLHDSVEVKWKQYHEEYKYVSYNEPLQSVQGLFQCSKQLFGVTICTCTVEICIHREQEVKSWEAIKMGCSVSDEMHTLIGRSFRSLVLQCRPCGVNAIVI